MSEILILLIILRFNLYFGTKSHFASTSTIINQQHKDFTASSSRRLLPVSVATYTYIFFFFQSTETRIASRQLLSTLAQ